MSKPDGPSKASKAVPPRAAETATRVSGPSDGSDPVDLVSKAWRMAPVSASMCAILCESDPPGSGLPMSSAWRMAPVSVSISAIFWESDMPPNMDPNKSNMDPESESE